MLQTQQDISEGDNSIMVGAGESRTAAIVTAL